MKRLILFASLLTMLFVVTPAFPQAQPQTQVYEINWDYTYSIPCANGGLGEDVRITGPVHAQETTVMKPDGTLNVIWTYNAQGLSGIGLTTGTGYHFVGVTRQSFTLFPGTVYPWEVTFINRNKIVGERSEANYEAFWETVHITVNANGETTVSFDTSGVVCK